MNILVQKIHRQTPLHCCQLYISVEDWFGALNCKKGSLNKFSKMPKNILLLKTFRALSRLLHVHARLRGVWNGCQMLRDANLFSRDEPQEESGTWKCCLKFDLTIFWLFWDDNETIILMENALYMHFLDRLWLGLVCCFSLSVLILVGSQLSYLLVVFLWHRSLTWNLHI